MNYFFVEQIHVYLFTSLLLDLRDHFLEEKKKARILSTIPFIIFLYFFTPITRLSIHIDLFWSVVFTSDTSGTTSFWYFKTQLHKIRNTTSYPEFLSRTKTQTCYHHSRAEFDTVIPSSKGRHYCFTSYSAFHFVSQQLYNVVPTTPATVQSQALTQ